MSRPGTGRDLGESALGPGGHLVEGRGDLGLALDRQSTKVVSNCWTSATNRASLPCRQVIGRRSDRRSAPVRGRAGPRLAAADPEWDASGQIGPRRANHQPIPGPVANNVEVGLQCIAAEHAIGFPPHSAALTSVAEVAYVPGRRHFAAANQTRLRRD